MVGGQNNSFLAVLSVIIIQCITASINCSIWLQRSTGIKLLAMLSVQKKLCSRVEASFAYQSIKAIAASPESGIAKSVHRRLLFYLVVSSTLE